ncbi:MAG TPA: glutathione S-transferase family protein [Devosiaceae bacterium]|jgi:glutathione S-transferase
MKLLIANKNYSSWSMRPWLVLRHFEIPFEEETLLLSGEGWKQKMIERSPNGNVPVLIDGDLAIPETLAIIEYIADLFPHKAIWPQDRKLRALARSASAEMHAGFSKLRSAAPMNLRASYPGRVPFEAVSGDLKRLDALWSDLLQRSGGPYLCGAFSAVDAMFAPVATRLRVYDLPVPDVATQYVEAIYGLPAFQEWLGEALKETWVVEQDEIDFIQGKTN